MTGSTCKLRQAARLPIDEARAMTINKKGRAGWHQATPKTSENTRNYTGLAACIKATIITLALWGLIPIAVADWIIHRGGLRDD